MQTKVILVEPEYEENIGLIARAMKNFPCKELLLVNPKARHYSSKARSRAMHAQEILRNAKKFNSLKEALKEVDFSAATSAKTTKEKKMLRKAITVKQLAENYSNTNASIGIVFGRESTGLKNKELNECDFLVKIPAHYKYKTLNVSHTAAIVLYELFCVKERDKGELKGVRRGKRKGELKVAKREKKKLLLSGFEDILEGCRTVQNKKAAKYAFKALISRAPVTEKEANALLSVFLEAKRKI